MKQSRHSEGLIIAPIGQVGAGMKIGEVWQPPGGSAPVR
jgi:hypothetical protein